tara:strand:- start:2119 stop:2721 length:603 start_codon:yes stop_codon:yes gene_type:complete
MSVTKHVAVKRRRWLWPGLMGVVVAGCVAPGVNGAKTASAGGVSIAGPPGFCVLDQSRVWLDEAEFAALLPCESGLSFAAPQAMLTVTVDAKGSATDIDLTREALAAYFNGPEGRAALSRAGKAKTVNVQEVRETSGAVVVRMTDSSARWPGLGWRAVTAVRGRLVTLTVRGNGTKDLTLATGRRLINRFVAAMAGANRA